MASSNFLHYGQARIWWQNAPVDMRERIKAVIAANPDMSVRSVSLAAGLSDSMLNKFLSGQTESMTIRNAEKLADALCVDPQWLIFGEGSPERAADIASLFERIPDNFRSKAREILETFARTGTSG